MKDYENVHLKPITLNDLEIRYISYRANQILKQLELSQGSSHGCRSPFIQIKSVLLDLKIVRTTTYDQAGDGGMWEW